MNDYTTLLENVDKALEENDVAQAQGLLRRGADQSGAPLEIFLRLMDLEIEEIVTHRREGHSRFPESFWHAHAFSHVLSLFGRRGAVYFSTQALRVADGEDQLLRGTLARIRAAVRTRDYTHLVQDFETIWDITPAPRLIGVRKTPLHHVSSSIDPEMRHSIDALLALPHLTDVEQLVLQRKRDQLEALAAL